MPQFKRIGKMTNIFVYCTAYKTLNWSHFNKKFKYNIIQYNLEYEKLITTDTSYNLVGPPLPMEPLQGGMGFSFLNAANTSEKWLFFKS